MVKQKGESEPNAENAYRQQNAERADEATPSIVRRPEEVQADIEALARELTSTSAEETPPPEQEADELFVGKTGMEPKASKPIIDAWVAQLKVQEAKAKAEEEKDS